MLVFIFLIGLSVLLYPSVSDYVNSLNQSRAMTVYSEKVSQIDPNAYKAVLEKAAEYNERLLKKPDRFRMKSEEQEEYKSLLNIGDTDVIGMVEVPAIHVKLPIYHGTNEAVLQVGVGHFEGASLPIGGPGTHSALSGHRGLPSAKLFSDLDQLKIDDRFTITVLGETLAYKVDQILVVEPKDMDSLEIVEGADYLTLITCTPYGVNSHRLLVRGVRTNNVSGSDTPEMLVVADATRIETKVLALVFAIPVFLVLLILYYIWRRRGRS